MISPESSSWSNTVEFLRRFQVNVDTNNKGLDEFNDLECESLGDLLLLRRKIPEVAATVELSFTGQVEQGIVTASVVLTTESVDVMKELFRREAYLAYSPTGRIDLGRIIRATLTTNTLVLVPKSTPQRQAWFSRVTFTPKTGALRSTARQTMYLGRQERIDLVPEGLRFTR